MQPDHRARYTFGFALLAALLAALILWNLNTGSLHLSPAEVMDILLTRTGENAAIVWEMRLPRLIAAMLLGGALSISGFLLQTFFANPIAGPFVLGISSGAKLTVSLLGVPVKKITMSAFIFMGMLSGLAGTLYAGRAQAARWDFGNGAEMNVIAAVVLGGTAMSGGTGSAIGAVVGSFLIMMINNGLVIGGLGVAQQTLMQGVIILIAVALSELGKKKRD